MQIILDTLGLGGFGQHAFYYAQAMEHVRCDSGRPAVTRRCASDHPGTCLGVADLVSALSVDASKGDVLNFYVLIHAVLGPFAATARLLDAAKGCGFRG